MREVTDEYLAEVEARCAAATEGPLKVDLDCFDSESGVIEVCVYDEKVQLMFTSECDVTVGSPFSWEKAAESREYKNGEFFAHARLDVPTLVAEVRRLRGELREALKTVGKHAYESGGVQGVLEAIGWQGGVDATVEGFRAENARLRAEVARLTTKLETK